MITDYFEAPATLERMRTSCVGPYLDDLVDTMAGAGYGALTIPGFSDHHAAGSAITMGEIRRYRRVVYL